MLKLNQNYIKLVVRKALKEDINSSGDVTTKLISNNKNITIAKIIAKQNGVIAGLNFCSYAFKSIDKKARFVAKIKDGAKVKKGQVVALIKAKVGAILTAERTALNFLSHTSGIATLTNEFVKKIKLQTKICCTRKTTPNLRLLEKYAVKVGGGFNHRFNLSDEIMIKDNHISFEKNLIKLIKKALKKKKIITVEVDNIKQLKSILGLKFKRILFDNMSLNALKKCLKLCKNKYETEYSGNVNLKNVRKIADTKVNRISIGALTHSAKAFDFSLELKKT